MAEIDYPPVQQALQRIRRLSADEEAQHYAMMRERAVRTEVTELRGAREEGRAEGREEGLKEGRDEGLAEGGRGMFIRLLQKRFGPLSDTHRDRIQRATSAEIDAWSGRLFDASSAAEVLGA